MRSYRCEEMQTPVRPSDGMIVEIQAELSGLGSQEKGSQLVLAVCAAQSRPQLRRSERHVAESAAHVRNSNGVLCRIAAGNGGRMAGLEDGRQNLIGQLFDSNRIWICVRTDMHLHGIYDIPQGYQCGLEERMPSSQRIQDRKDSLKL